MINNKILKKVVLLSLITMSIVYASKLVELNNRGPAIHYHEMDTQELQVKVEELSQNSELPFEMGLELIKRWSTAK